MMIDTMEVPKPNSNTVSLCLKYDLSHKTKKIIATMYTAKWKNQRNRATNYTFHDFHSE